MKGFREWINTSGGKTAAIVGTPVVLALFVWVIWTNVRSEAASISRQGMYIDSKTAKPFSYTIQIGDTIPVMAPTGGKTGFPAELCYWTKDGKIKSEPTQVLLNRYVGKPEPTFCPDCGRLVRSRNPAPATDSKPPLLQQDFKPANRGED